MTNTHIIGQEFNKIEVLTDYMRNAATSIEELRDKVPDELKPYVSQFRGNLPWLVLQHPLAYAIPFHGGDGEIRSVMDAIETKKRIIAESDGSGKPWEAVWMYERPWRLSALIDRKHVWPSDQMNEYYRTIGGVWVDSENIHQNKGMWALLLTETVNKGMSRHLMEDDDLKLWNRLSAHKSVDVFRGSSHQNRRGFSWTVDKGRAEWFASRFSQKNKVYKTTVNLLSDAVATFAGRGESEVVLKPNFIKKATIIPA